MYTSFRIGWYSQFAAAKANSMDRIYILPLRQTVTERCTVVTLMTQNRATFLSLSELLCAPTYKNILHKTSLGLVSCLFFLRSKWHVQPPATWRKATCTTLKVEDKIVFASFCQSWALLLMQIWFERAGLREKQALPPRGFLSKNIILFLVDIYKPIISHQLFLPPILSSP